MGALSPDSCLTEYHDDYKWFAKVNESVKLIDSHGDLVLATFSAKIMELVYH